MMRLGKHRGRQFQDVAAADRGYCAWVLREKSLPRGLSAFHKYLIGVHGGILTVGKHRGKFFDEVLSAERDYCEWAMTLQDPSESFLAFVAYIKAHMMDDEGKAKRRRTEEKLCVICCDRPVNCVFVPCGHLAACISCGLKFDGRDCPICKQHVSLVVRTYSA